MLEDLLRGLSMVRENKKDYLLCVLFCCNMPKILQCFSHLTSIFSQEPLREQVVGRE